jgi:hypothetical protein
MQALPRWRHILSDPIGALGTPNPAQVMRKPSTELVNRSEHPDEIGRVARQAREDALRRFGTRSRCRR